MYIQQGIQQHLTSNKINNSQPPKIVYPSSNQFIKQFEQPQKRFLLLNHTHFRMSLQRTPTNKQPPVNQNFTNSTLNISQSHQKITQNTLNDLNETEISHLSTFFTNQKLSELSELKNNYPSSTKNSDNKTHNLPLQIDPKQKFNWELLEYNPKQPRSSKENFNNTITFMSETQNQLPSFITTQESEEKEDIQSRFKTEKDEFCSKVNSFHLQFYRGNKMAKTKKPNVASTSFTQVPNTSTHKSKGINVTHHTSNVKSIQNVKPQLEISKEKEDQEKLKVVIRQEANQKTKRKLSSTDVMKNIEEYSYRKNNTQKADQAAMSFFQSVNSYCDEPIGNKHNRSKSMQHCVMSMKLKDMINQVMSNTKEFDSFIQCIKKK